MRWPPPLLALCLCCLRCAALRTEAPPARGGPRKNAYDVGEGVQALEGELVRPLGRHIQYLVVDHPHGISDRMFYFFRPLVGLGLYHNATVHIAGGRTGPARWLAGFHTLDQAPSWDRYFDLRANRGNPFHELENFQGCKNVKVKSLPTVRAWKALFDDGSLCVNIVENIKINHELDQIARETDADLPVSSWIKTSARSFLKNYGVKMPYGSYHIRRCDLLGGHLECTAPSVVYSVLAENKTLDSWLFFMYAEAKYRSELREHLRPLGKQLFFEDDVELNNRFPGDNYFTYVVGKYLHAGATEIVETHHCKGPDARIYHTGEVPHNGLFLANSPGIRSGPADTGRFVRETAYLEADAAYEAVCGDSERGAHLLRPSPPPSDEPVQDDRAKNDERPRAARSTRPRAKA